MHVPPHGGPLHIMPIFGTRPEAVKMAPVIKALAGDARFKVSTVVTAQHREMLDQVMKVFSLKSSHDLGLMRDGQSLADLTARSVVALDALLQHERPHLVLVHGDTTTTFTAGLVSFYHHIPVGHVEAGLRTHDRHQPFPEEMNRKLVGCLADLHFAPTKAAADNLAEEGVAAERIFITGNSVIDALNQCLASLKAQGITAPRSVATGRPYLLVTVHRRENWGDKLSGICRALLRVLASHPELDLIMPVHLNPIVRDTVHSILGGRFGVHLLPPVDYDEMVLLMSGAYLVLTDSGGLQEEAPALGRPVLVLRNATERPEALAAGTVKLAGTDEEGIYALTCGILENKAEYCRMAGAVNPYGDGRAAARIKAAVLYSFGLDSLRPEPFDPGNTPV